MEKSPPWSAPDARQLAIVARFVGLVSGLSTGQSVGVVDMWGLGRRGNQKIREVVKKRKLFRKQSVVQDTNSEETGSARSTEGSLLQMQDSLLL